MPEPFKAKKITQHIIDKGNGNPRLSGINCHQVRYNYVLMTAATYSSKTSLNMYHTTRRRLHFHSCENVTCHFVGNISFFRSADQYDQTKHISDLPNILPTVHCDCIMYVHKHMHTIYIKLQTIHIYKLSYMLQR